MDFIITEANKLAKKSLSYLLLSYFVEARIIGYGKDRKLIFYFTKFKGIDLFRKQRTQILEKLRTLYKEKMSFYKSQDFIFYGIEAKNANEMKHRSLQELETLERGIARLANILEKTRAERKRL